MANHQEKTREGSPTLSVAQPFNAQNDGSGQVQVVANTSHGNAHEIIESMEQGVLVVD